MYGFTGHTCHRPAGNAFSTPHTQSPVQHALINRNHMLQTNQAPSSQPAKTHQRYRFPLIRLDDFPPAHDGQCKSSVYGSHTRRHTHTRNVCSERRKYAKKAQQSVLCTVQQSYRVYLSRWRWFMHSDSSGTECFQLHADAGTLHWMTDKWCQTRAARARTSGRNLRNIRNGYTGVGQFE